MSKVSLRFDRDEFTSILSDFLQALDIVPNNPAIYLQAAIHRSVLNESGGYVSSNERLEYLGDAVLELIITEQLYHDFPQEPEGRLTDIRSAIVRGRNLAYVATQLQFSQVIQLSRGEYRVSGHQNPYILANTLEAFIGAMYLDQGFGFIQQWVLQHIYSTLPRILEQGLFVDPKSFLQELTQEIWGVIPLYVLVGEVGADHNKEYLVEIELGGKRIGKGKGSSKKKAEQDAAENAIAIRKDWEKDIPLPKKHEA